MSFFRLNSLGQAVVEYLLLVAFLIILTSNLALKFTDFMRESVGNLGHVVSLNLSVGVCERDCFFATYNNGSDE